MIYSQPQTSQRDFAFNPSRKPMATMKPGFKQVSERKQQLALDNAKLFVASLAKPVDFEIVRESE